MKTLHISIIVLLASGLIAYTTNSVYASCLVGVIECGPPPGVKVSISTDSQFYEKNDTINIQGQVYVQNYSKPIHIQVVNSDNATIKSIDTPVVEGKFGLKIKADFDATGDYHVTTCVQGWCDRWFFKFVAEPYKLTVNRKDFFINYKSFADLAGMEADINSQALRVHISNATSQGEQFVIELPRALIDSKRYDGNDTNFRVFFGIHQPDKYMQPANFTEIASNDWSRTLAINIPYDPVPNSSGIWDFKIMSANTVSGPSVNYEPPQKQFKSGIAANDVKCEQGLQLVIKSEDGSPACVKPDTARKLIERGWAKITVTIATFDVIQSNTTQTNAMANLGNDTGITTIDNQTYYFETPIYSHDAYLNSPQISFHDVVFTLFPSGFRGGLPMTTCGGQYYWASAKFSDGTNELLHIFVNFPQCSSPQPPIYFSTHTNPQAGLTFYGGKMKLLVSTNIVNSITSPEFKVGQDLLGPIPHQLVFFMKSNSTARIFVEYTSHEPNIGTMPSYSSVYVDNGGNYTPLTTSDVSINADPSSIPLTEGSDTMVVYNITAKEGVKGVYWISLTQFCRVMPLVIDINSLTISPFDIPVQTGTMYCPAQVLDGKILGISEGTAEYKVGQPVK